MGIKNFTFFAVVFAILLAGCSSIDVKDRKNHLDTAPICGLVFVETYKVSEKEDIRSNYITDSTRFRVFVGSYHEADGGINYTCKGDSIIAETVIWKKGEPRKVTDTKIFSLSKLRNKHSFRD